MAAGYDRVELDPPQPNLYTEIQFSVLSFLHQFDIFYTLNQDTLIEQKCGPFIARGAVGQFHCPGVKKAHQTLDVIGHRIELCEPDLPNFHLGTKPYIKLQGSFNWIQDRGIMLILGGGKAENIKKYPLLTRYHEEFRKDLNKPGTRLMIIGYGFGDPHINQVIADTAGNLDIFIIDPLGVDVLDKRNPRAQILEPAGDLMQKLNPRLIGASRRSLREIFGSDRVEHAKVMRFFRR